ncbi:MAG: transcription factor FapR [Sulfobacillus thermosulfidooxidans]|uniref:Fatty acid biosynthesis transcriptional regulator n=1 Tax=Sulfobacillus thermotolerans TaxID=338644 RepID=A0ABN5H4H6_9FIRM|nr:transcription factor FapR [Sulfobacillus sp. hq2]AUW94523.1 fatty acid biosynthesis transcriptional regulator [Sulfobacillus thermotolerans]MCY0908056.1 transcription factor FapR [Sulfobacillus thermotolerans]POB09182.1 fatty acid biosynthesis transcriptional regulator [Sulfobacillus sp. hq2]PSR36904.1 MAG: transcription factor FapR [Sulfobacillus thermosulfidooxidans]
MARLNRVERQRKLAEAIRENPLQTDEDLAQRFSVSVPTIRLDRLHLGIPELRLRSEGLARLSVVHTRTLKRQDMVGDLIDLVIGQSGRSLLRTDESMAFAQSGVVQSHFIFAQADSLALAVVDGAMAVTGLANAKFKNMVHAGQQIIAGAEVIRRQGHRWVVLVISRVGDVTVFRGKFVVLTDPFDGKAKVSMDNKEGALS